MNKIESRRYDSIAKTLLLDNKYFQIIEDKSVVITLDLLEAIVENARRLKSLGHASNFYSDKLFRRYINGTAMNLSKHKVEGLSLLMVKQVVTQCLSK